MTATRHAATVKYDIECYNPTQSEEMDEGLQSGGGRLAWLLVLCVSLIEVSRLFQVRFQLVYSFPDSKTYSHDVEWVHQLPKAFTSRVEQIIEATNVKSPSTLNTDVRTFRMLSWSSNLHNLFHTYLPSSYFDGQLTYDFPWPAGRRGRSQATRV